MKHTYLILIMLSLSLWPFPVSGQDTVTFYDSVYLIKDKSPHLAWESNDTIVGSGTLVLTVTDFPIVYAVADFPLDTLTMIYGIAITLDTVFSPSLYGYLGAYDFFSDTNRFFQLKLMIKPSGKDSVADYVTIDSMSMDCNGLPPLIKQNKFQYTVDSTDAILKNTEGNHPVRSSFELYFKTPHTMTDTFYLGYWNDMHEPVPNNWNSFLTYYVPRIHIPYEHKTGSYSPNERYYFNECKYWNGNYYNDWETIIEYMGRLYPWGLVFPIVKLRCRGGLKGMDLYDKGKGYARVVWDYDEWDDTQHFEVRLDTVNTLTGDTVEVYHGFVDDTLALFTGLAEGQAYRCSVRKSCRYATSSYDTTLWSDTWQHVEFATDIYGISQPDGTDFSLSPNPASGTARLTLPRPIDEDATVVLRDLCGRTLATAVLPRGATELAIPLDGLAPSAYLVQLTTPTALSTRRLVVR